MAIMLLRTMEEGSYKPDIIVYSTVIDGLCKDRMVDDAMKLFSKMNEQGIRPDVITYTSLIHGLCNFGWWKKATEILREMLDSGIAPNVRTFNVLVDAACTKEGRMKEEDGVFEVMIQRGVDPDVVTCNTVMGGHCLQGQMDETIRVSNTMVNKVFTLMCAYAKEHFDEMQAAGLAPNIPTYNIMLDGLCKNGHITESYSLFRMMENNGLDVDVVMYTVFIDGFCKVKNLDTARDISNKLSSSGGLHPDVKACTRMIQGLCEEGLLDEAKKLFVKMEKNSGLPNDVNYKTIIGGFLGQQKCYEALVLLEKMLQKGFSPDASTSSLIVDLISTRGQDPTLQDVIKKFFPKDSHGMQEIE
ncbi:hypothetical protein HYC85_003409 [Camellia sinensis]|uniref:Pentacotripeptide-repeat region of PRORP domain-containing protein n=1 Tax=Camellia sinensis TaxID=4442 RepID=A0A7J7IB85_CAMSI|nr:hypothetical protein HYC85_003409 [Camellia sinensis]